MATLGLSKCYERVGARMGKSPPRGGWGQGPQDVLYTSEDGTLRLGPHLPLFMNRCVGMERGGGRRRGGGGRGRESMLGYGYGYGYGSVSVLCRIYV
jgi:hypothetical protein